MNLQLINIYNKNRLIYLFIRDNGGNLSITKDDSLHPYYFEPDPKGTYNGFGGKKLRKIVVSIPSDVKRMRSPNSMEADILFPKRYIIDKIDSFAPCPIKCLFLDLEVLTKELPDIKEALYPISCITIYNSFSKQYMTWYLGDYDGNEIAMLGDFVDYIQCEKPDLLLAWNCMFDYNYLYGRIHDFAKKISPINESRYGDYRNDKVFYPAGISVVDYMTLFKKIYMRESSYTLNNIAQKYLNEPINNKIDFNVLSEDIRNKNFSDVQKLVKLEEKFGIINYYNEIRLMSTCLWEDLVFHSKVLDMVLLREAHKRNFVLPNKQKSGDNKESYEGAYRFAQTGRFENIYKADAASMYPSMIINFCIDNENILQPNEVGNLGDLISVNNISFKQNSNALLPYLTKKLLNKKDEAKTYLKTLDKNGEEYKLKEKTYEAIKSLVNALYGYTGLPSSRIYNKNIAATITWLARDLMYYVENKMKLKGFEVLYLDTDCCFYKADDDKIDLLNKLVKEWALNNYHKHDIDIKFESEGKFEKIIILGSCHYYGIMKDKKEPEIRGLAMKRSSSSKYEGEFQKELITKVLNNETRENILVWIKQQIEDIKNKSLEDISFPAKIAQKEYKNVSIFLRAVDNTKKIDKTFRVEKGEIFYYTFVKDENEVLAFNDKFKISSDNINYSELIRRNILLKAEGIFESMKWDMTELIPPKVKKERKKKESTIATKSEKVAEVDSVDNSAKECPQIVNVHSKVDIIKNKTFIAPYFETKLGKLYNCNCLDFFPTLKDDSVDLVITSPPYNCGNKGKNKDMYKEYIDNLSDEDYYNLLDSSLKECLRICKGPIFYNINYMNNNKSVLYKWIYNNVNYLRENIIWDKGRVQPPIGNILGKRYEYIFLFTKDPKYSINTFKINRADKYKKEFGNWISNLIQLDLKTDQIKFAKKHRAGFPVKLPEMFIDIYTKEGDVIIDPFLGLGSSSLAAEKLNRKWLGCELIESYCQIAKERIIDESR